MQIVPIHLRSSWAIEHNTLSFYAKFLVLWCGSNLTASFKSSSSRVKVKKGIIKRKIEVYINIDVSLFMVCVKVEWRCYDLHVLSLKHLEGKETEKTKSEIMCTFLHVLVYSGCQKSLDKQVG